jgi:glutaredoxin-dependent peroxiredoxin
MPTIGSAAPDFTLFDSALKPRTLKEFAGRKTVVAFYPGAFTGPCTQEMCTFRDSMAQLNDLDADVVGISVDGPFANGEFAKRNGLEFPLLSDYGREAVKAYGLELPDFAGMTGYTASQRAVFILDNDNIVRWSWVAPSPGIEPDYAQVIDELGKI